MRDPHVVALHYRLATGPQLALDHPPPVERELDSFIVRVDDGCVRVEMKDHFATVVAARLEVEPFLRSWEIKAALRYGPDAITFAFDGPEVIDRDPPPPETSAAEAVAGAAARRKQAGLAGFSARPAGQASRTEGPARRVSFSELLGGWRGSSEDMREE